MMWTTKTYITASSVARASVSEQQAHTVVAQDTLLHGESLLVVSSSNATHHSKTVHDLPEDVTLELLTEAVTLDLLGDSLVHESTAREMRRSSTIPYSLFSSSISMGF